MQLVYVYNLYNSREKSMDQFKVLAFRGKALLIVHIINFSIIDFCIIISRII